MFAQVNTFLLAGVEAQPIKVEVDIQAGLPYFEIVGLASTAIKEARERVRAAIKNSGFEFPNRKIIVNLAPADQRKEGSHFDLAIAWGILVASEQVAPARAASFFLTGELSLNGETRPVPGVLPMLIKLVAEFPSADFVVPQANLREARLIIEVNTVGVADLQELADFMQGGQRSAQEPKMSNFAPVIEEIPDFSEVRGQETAKRALEIAAAGRHNILMIGAPGGGKTMLARRLPGIMPTMTRAEILSATQIYSVANLLLPEQPLIQERPFRAPHKNASAASIIGGGRVPLPGEISLAQHGVLFLDEMPEFSRDVLEALRQPLEDKQVTIARTTATLTYPADFLLVGAMNPCPCGNFGSDKECRCTPWQIQRYLQRLSGPLLDRIDLQVEVPRVSYDKLSQTDVPETSARIRSRVEAAWQIQQIRFADSSTKVNAQIKPRELNRFCHLHAGARQLLKNAFERLGMSARAYSRVLKISRTVADLAGSENIEEIHVAEALQYRSLDKKYWCI